MCDGKIVRYASLMVAMVMSLSQAACKSTADDNNASVKDTEASVLADSITVGDVKGTIQADGIALDQAQAYLLCKYADGAEFNVKTPSQELASTLTSLGQPVGGGKLYSFSAQGGKLKPGLSGLLKLRACSYNIHFEGTNTKTGERVLSSPDVSIVIGARTNGSLNKITDPGLNARVASTMAPLKLRLSVSNYIEADL